MNIKNRVVQRPHVSCIIPCYNEATRIAEVLTAVAGHPLIDEVVVVDDGSTDETARVVRDFPTVTLITLSSNGGKTSALRRGITETKGEILLFLDADLQGITDQHVQSLLEPVCRGEADVAISLRGNAPLLWRLIGLDYISGERALPRVLIAPHLSTLQTLPHFGFEVFLNSLILQHHQRIAVIHWSDVVSPLKNTKYGLWRGVRADIGMLRDIFKTASFIKIISQIYHMRLLRT